MRILSGVDSQLLTSILLAGGETDVSLFELAADLGIGYNHARSRAHRLAAMGSVCIDRSAVAGRQGHSLKLCCRCLLPETECGSNPLCTKRTHTEGYQSQLVSNPVVARRGER